MPGLQGGQMPGSAPRGGRMPGSQGGQMPGSAAFGARMPAQQKTTGQHPGAGIPRTKANVQAAHAAQKAGIRPFTDVVGAEQGYYADPDHVHGDEEMYDDQAFYGDGNGDEYAYEDEMYEDAEESTEMALAAIFPGRAAQMGAALREEAGIDVTAQRFGLDFGLAHDSDILPGLPLGADPADVTGTTPTDIAVNLGIPPEPDIDDCPPTIYARVRESFRAVSRSTIGLPVAAMMNLITLFLCSAPPMTVNEPAHMGFGHEKLGTVRFGNQGFPERMTSADSFVCTLRAARNRLPRPPRTPMRARLLMWTVLMLTVLMSLLARTVALEPSSPANGTHVRRATDQAFPAFKYFYCTSHNDANTTIGTSTISDHYFFGQWLYAHDHLQREVHPEPAQHQGAHSYRHRR